MAHYKQPVEKRVIKRTVDTSAAEAKATALERLKALDAVLKETHPHHNEVRRISIQMLHEIVSILSE